MQQLHKNIQKYKTKKLKTEVKKMNKISEHRVTIPLNEEEYKKLKYITEYLKKYTKNSETTPKILSKLLSITIEALDDKKIEARTALLSVIDKESKEKNIKAILEKFQNDQDNITDIDSPKIIENLIFLSNIQKAIKKIEEDNTKITKENEDKKNENRKETEKTTEKTKETETVEKKQQPTQTQEEEKPKTKIENNKETKDKQNDEEEILRFPDL
jgi:hypothetical protein